MTIYSVINFCLSHPRAELGRYVCRSLVRPICARNSLLQWGHGIDGGAGFDALAFLAALSFTALAVLFALHVEAP